MEPDTPGDSNPRERRMTVARVRLLNGVTEIMFLESARIYRLPPSAPRYEELLQRLRTAETSGRRVRVRLTEAHGDVIEDVD